MKLNKPYLERSLCAEHSCRMAVKKNDINGSCIAGISIDDAETLLDWIVYNARNAIVAKSAQTKGENIENLGHDRARAMLDDPDVLFGKCGIVQSVTGYQSEMLGIECLYHQMFWLHPQSAFSHTITVLNIPIDDQETVHLKSVLVDPSIRQFEHNHREVDWLGNLQTTGQGRYIARQLFKNGYLFLDDALAQCYVEAQTRTHQIPFDPVTLQTSTASNFFDIQEIINDGIDIRTPSMMKANQPLSDAAIIWQHMRNPLNRFSALSGADIIINPHWQSQSRFQDINLRNNMSP